MPTVNLLNRSLLRVVAKDIRKTTLFRAYRLPLSSMRRKPLAETTRMPFLKFSPRMSREPKRLIARDCRESFAEGPLPFFDAGDPGLHETSPASDKCRATTAALQHASRPPSCRAFPGKPRSRSCLKAFADTETMGVGGIEHQRSDRRPKRPHHAPWRAKFVQCFTLGVKKLLWKSKNLKTDASMRVGTADAASLHDADLARSESLDKVKD